MAIKSSDQLTIIDVTDAYSVMLTSEAYTFVGDSNGVAAGASCSTQAVAYCGPNQCAVVDVDADAITCPSGISSSVSNNGTANPTITFTTTATISTACEATIPISVGDVVVNKKFSFAVAKSGVDGAAGSDGAQGPAGPTGPQGPQGNAGADALTVTITASNGTVFKNGSGSTVLTAHVFKGALEQSITDAGVVANSLGTIKWYKGTSTTVIKTGKSLTVSASDVSGSVAYTAQLE